MGRRAMKRGWICAVGAVICAAVVSRGGGASAAAWTPEGLRIAASASPTRVTVGDPIRFTLAVSVPDGMTVSPPAVGPRAGVFRIKEIGRRSARDAKTKREEMVVLYDLRAYRAGEWEIPPLKVVAADGKGGSAEADAGPITVLVESVLDKEAKDIRDIKQPLSLSYFPLRPAAWMAAGLCAAAVAAFLLARFRRRGIAAAPPPRPPHEIAYEELSRLEAMALPAAGRLGEYYMRLSAIIRRYIEGRFGLKAPEMTTEEFLSAAGASGLLDPRARALVGDFLEQCDMVKFARYGPSAEEAGRAFGAAVRFVDETKPAGHDAPTGGAAPAPSAPHGMKGGGGSG